MFLHYLSTVDNPWKIIPHLEEAKQLWSVCFPDSEHEIEYKGEPVFTLVSDVIGLGDLLLSLLA